MRKFAENKYWHWGEVPTSHRTMEEYFELLHLNSGMISGKKILDIGAGTKRFAKEASELDIGAEIYSVDPIYCLSVEKMDKQLLKSKENIEYIKAFNTKVVRQRTAAALAEELPFKEKTFDLVISCFCFPMYANNEQQVRKFFADIARILKRDGEIRLYPVGLGAIKKKEVLLAIDAQVNNLIENEFVIIENKNDLLIIKKTA